MPLLNDDDVKITKLTKQIVEDYFIYSHSTESLIFYGCKDEEIIKDCRFRQTITTHIINMECENALQLIKTHKMYEKNDQIIDLLYKQLFIECVYKNDYTKAISIASEYMASGKSDKDVFSILGYKNDKQLIELLCGKARRQHCCEKVNDLMLEMVNGKKKNMLWYMCNQQASIVHYSQ